MTRKFSWNDFVCPDVGLTLPKGKMQSALNVAMSASDIKDMLECIGAVMDIVGSDKVPLI